MATVSSNKALFYAPRVIAILGILFISSFALDVFEPGKSAGYILTALFMHLIPSFVLVAMLVVAWKFERFGGMLFILVCVVPFIFLSDNGFFGNLVLISPFLITGLLFFIHGQKAAAQQTDA